MAVKSICTGSFNRVKTAFREDGIEYLVFADHESRSSWLAHRHRPEVGNYPGSTNPDFNFKNLVERRKMLFPKSDSLHIQITSVWSIILFRQSWTSVWVSLVLESDRSFTVIYGISRCKSNAVTFREALMKV